MLNLIEGNIMDKIATEMVKGMMIGSSLTSLKTLKIELEKDIRANNPQGKEETVEDYSKRVSGLIMGEVKLLLMLAIADGTASSVSI